MGASRSARSRHPDSAIAWVPGDLRRPTTLLGAVAAFAVSVPLSFNVSCQVHEFSHALVGTALGWTVDRVHLCLPAGGTVDYVATPGAAWINTTESFAGGLIAAAFLALLYLVAFQRPGTPLRGPGWWAAGFGPAIWIGPQLFIAAVEGANPHRDYTAVLDANLPLTMAALLLTMAAGATAHVWLWRSIWTRTRPVVQIDT